MRVVFDENISPHLVELMVKCGSPGEICHTRKMGWNQMDDSLWMPIAIAAGYAIVSGDRNERTRKITAGDFRAMNAKVILLGAFWDHLRIWDKAKWMVARWDLLHFALEELAPGSCQVAAKSGKLVDA